MESTIWLADGFVVITGDIGSGKTTLIESFLGELPSDVVLAHVNQTQLSPVEFLQALLVEFGFQPFRMRKIELLTMLRDYMIEQYAAGKKVLLVVDEAQNLPRAVLEEIRMLSGIEAQKEKLLRIILAGQPELSSKLDSPRLEQLTQRVRLRFHLGALSKKETRDYVLHRLDVAGAEGRQVFTDEALDVVFRYSGGVPRLTNIICDTAMLCGFAEECSVVDARLVKAAAEELQWVEYSERTRDRTGTTGQFLGPASVSPASLDLLFHDQLVTNVTLSPGRMIIGRTSDNDLQIRSKFISRHHAQITTDRHQCVIEDLNSTNGLYVGARRVKHHVLRDGDAVQLGEHTLVYRDGRASFGHMERDRFTDTGSLGREDEWPDEDAIVRADADDDELGNDGGALEGADAASDLRKPVPHPAAVEGGSPRPSNGASAARTNGHEVQGIDRFEATHPDARGALSRRAETHRSDDDLATPQGAAQRSSVQGAGER
jgi:type II secretory pathway predicted ATPase ExeA/pSer/pThr/pTyr-binding forkhead associated (FHA) protein